jgi:hypothetical protein
MANERQSHAERLERLAARELAARLGAAGWQLERDPQLERRPDLLFSRGSDQLVVEVKAMPGSPRRALLPGLLADAILRARRIAVDLNAMPLAIVAAKSLSDSMVEELAQYVDDYANGAAWGVVDERGRFAVRGVGLESVRSSRSEPQRRASSRHHFVPKSQLADPFSDLGQWMIKVLFAEEIPAQFLNAPRQGVGIRNISELAERADVSLASASKFVAALESIDYADREAGEIELVLRDQLMRFWSSKWRGAKRELPARLVIPSDKPLERMKEALRRHRRSWPSAAPAEAVAESVGRFESSRPRACLAQFSACDALGVGVVRDVMPHIYIEGFDQELIDELGFMFVDRGQEADVVLREPKFPESVFRGCVDVDGVPVSDILQCWIDAWMDQGRGYEQVKAIRDRLVQLGVFE